MAEQLTPQFPQYQPPKGIPIAEKSFAKPLTKLMTKMLKPPKRMTLKAKPRKKKGSRFY